jgi:hypothetical protein
MRQTSPKGLASSSVSRSTFIDAGGTPVAAAFAIATASSEPVVQNRLVGLLPVFVPVKRKPPALFRQLHAKTGCSDAVRLHMLHFLG